MDVLEWAYADIKQEFELFDAAKLQEFDESSLHNGGWWIYPFAGRGRQFIDHQERFPETWQAIQQVPGVQAAAISCLLPGGRIHPHVHDGLNYGSVSVTKTWVCHLGLVIPEGSGLRVAGVDYVWQPGKAVCFDSSQVHETWNDSGLNRYVLLLDFDP